MFKLVLAIRSLDIGGAERQFIELLKHIDKQKFDITVCTMYGGVQEESVKSIQGIRYVNLQKMGRYDFFKFYKAYRSLLKEIDPDVIYSFLGEMNLFSLWCKPKKSKIIWGFRASNMDLKKYGRIPQILFWLQNKFSSRVDRIIANSNASIEFHKTQGFDMSRSVMIANGIDTDRFKKDLLKRKEFRVRYQLKESDIAIGIVARIDHMKGYVVFSKAAKRILQSHDNIYFFSVGGGDTEIKEECSGILGDTKRFLWLGNQNKVEDIYSGLDVSVSSSLGEGFSNAIAEAMSCELPCVVTDVGDSSLIVGETGIVVKPKNEESLYNGLMQMIQSDFKSLGQKSRDRIVNHFSVQQMVQKTEEEIVKCAV